MKVNCVYVYLLLLSRSQIMSGFSFSTHSEMSHMLNAVSDYWTFLEKF